MHIWMMLQSWFMQVRGMQDATALMAVAAVFGGVALAAWPRGCCKQDELFQRRTV